MTQDEIIEIARQAGLSNPLWIENDYAIIEAFAKLVEERTAAKERKEMAEHCVEITRMTVDKAVASAIEKERVACFDAAYDAYATTAVLEAIRARGEA